MRLSIITINWNNAAGLEKTMLSVASQTFKEFEYVIIDGASTDNSVDIIKKNESNFTHLNWVSEPDNGIYNAINKGISKASGDYIQILNSGDLLINDDIIEKMMAVLADYNYPELLYGNAVDVDGDKRLSSHGPGIKYSMLLLYRATYPHDSTFFKRELFSGDRYGLYDESLKIVSDWKWYLQAIGLGNVKPVYVDIDITLFDVHGISSTNKELDKKERRKVLEEVMPPAILVDYDEYAFPIQQYERLRKHHLWKVVYFFERVLFKFEKWHILK